MGIIRHGLGVRPQSWPLPMGSYIDPESHLAYLPFEQVFFRKRGSPDADSIQPYW